MICFQDNDAFMTWYMARLSIKCKVLLDNRMTVRLLLNLPVPCISEIYIEIQIKLKFLFSHFFVVPQMSHHKKKYNLSFSLRPGLGREGLSFI